MSVFLSPGPGVTIQELNLSQGPALTSGTTVAMVFASDQGPLQPTYVTGDYFNDWVTLYGNSDPATSFAHDCAKPILDAGAPILALRVANGAYFSGTTYYNSVAAAPFSTTSLDFTANSVTLDYQSGGSKQLAVLTIGGPLITGNQISLPITSAGGVTTAASVTFSTNSDATLAALATAIANDLNSISGISGAIANALSVAGSSGTSNRSIVIQLPQGATVIFGTPTITSGTSQPTVTFNQDAQLFDVFTQNPGSWGNTVGVKITNMDQGIPQVQTLTFSQAFVTGNTFNGQLNGSNFGPITYDTNSNQTLQDIANAIALLPGVASAVVSVVAGSLTNNRVIIVTASAPGPNTLTFTSLITAGGASQPTTLVAQTLTGVASSGQFDLQVYLNTNTNTPVETFRCTLGIAQDGLGNQLNIATTVNTGPNASNYIRIYQPSWSQSLSLGGTINNGVLAVDQAINWLGGGANGASVTTAQLINGLSTLVNRQLYPFNLLISCGYTDPVYQQALANFAQTRQDCFAILDMPSAYQTSQLAYNWATQNLNINTSYAAIYTPDIQYVDPVTDQIRLVPPSGAVAAVYATNDKQISLGHAPAGLKIGTVGTAALRVDYNDNDVGLMYPQPACVNPIVRRSGQIVVWGDNTLSKPYSALAHVSVRRIMSLIEITVADAVDYNTFDPNNSITQFEVAQEAEGILQPLLGAEEINGYEVVCDERNNTPDIVAAGQLRCDVYVDPGIPAVRILVRGIVTKTGANFSELIQQLSTGG